MTTGTSDATITSGWEVGSLPTAGSMAARTREVRDLASAIRSGWGMPGDHPLAADWGFAAYLEEEDGDAGPRDEGDGDAAAEALHTCASALVARDAFEVWRAGRDTALIGMALSRLVTDLGLDDGRSPGDLLRHRIVAGRTRLTCLGSDDVGTEVEDPCVAEVLERAHLALESTPGARPHGIVVSDLVDEGRDRDGVALVDVATD